MKSFWARDEIRYKRYFDDTELFIIFGMSITKTDAWWMKRIYKQLMKGKAELIIYYYRSNLTSEEIKEQFFRACLLDEAEECSMENVKEKIYIVRHNDNRTCFLGVD